MHVYVRMNAFFSSFFFFMCAYVCDLLESVRGESVNRICDHMSALICVSVFVCDYVCLRLEVYSCVLT